MDYPYYMYRCHDYVSAKERMKMQKKQIADNNRKNSMKYRNRYE